MKILKLTVFLAIVSALAGGILSYVNELTAPIIANQSLAAEKANLEVIFPGGSFSEITFEDATGLVKSGYQAEGEGFAFKVEVTGYNSSSPVQFMIGFDLSGNIVGFEVLAQQETNGLGAKVAEPEFKESVVGKTVNDTINTISGATVTSTAVIKGINAAKEVYASVAGVDVSVEEPAVPETKKVSLKEDFSDNQATIISEEDGVFTIESTGYHGANVYQVTVAEGKVVSIVMTEFNDTEGIGDQVNEAYLSTLAGADLDSELDVVSGATYTSRSALAAIQLALGGTEEATSETSQNAETTEALYSDEKATIVSETDGVYTVEAKGYQGTNVYQITVSEGAIVSVVMDEFNDTPGIGDQVDEEYLAKFVGVTEVDEADIVSSATYTSKSAQAAVQAVLDYTAEKE